MNVPNNLDECFAELERQFGEEMVRVFREEKEEDLPKYHLGTGMGIRNGWGLWAGSQLAKYFEEMGIFHPDDMSAIILTSYHRYLNNKDVKLDEQRKYFAVSQRQWGKMQPKSNDRPNEKQESLRSRLTLYLRSALSQLWK